MLPGVEDSQKFPPMRKALPDLVAFKVAGHSTKGFELRKPVNRLREYRNQAMFLTTPLIGSLALLCIWLPIASAEQSCKSFHAGLPNVTILATGGTIASRASSNTQTTNYKVGVGIEALLDAVPEICNISNVSGVQVSNVDSGSINSTILLDLTARLMAELANPSAHGVVVTHGTDTLEETAFFLDLVLNSTKPVVITGAMRPSTALSADGPLNLYQAVKLAASKTAFGRGVMVALNEYVLSPMNDVDSDSSFANMLPVESVVPTRQRRTMPIPSILSTRPSKGNLAFSSIRSPNSIIRHRNLRTSHTSMCLARKHSRMWIFFTDTKSQTLISFKRRSNPGPRESYSQV